MVFCPKLVKATLWKGQYDFEVNIIGLPKYKDHEGWIKAQTTELRFKLFSVNRCQIENYKQYTNHRGKLNEWIEFIKSQHFHSYSSIIYFPIYCSILWPKIAREKQIKVALGNLKFFSRLFSIFDYFIWNCNIIKSTLSLFFVYILHIGWTV